MHTPLVSIIIPVYNAEKYIAATIESAINQTWPNKEIIIIDDGSTDTSINVARQFANDTIKVYQQENKGAAAARNKGLLQSKGDFIQFLDADDLLSINKIASQLNLLLQNPGKLAVCSTVHFSGAQDPVKARPSAYEDAYLYDTDDPAAFLINLYGGNNNRGSMVQPNAWLTPVAIIKKAGNWNEQLSVDDDGEFFCRAILSSDGIVYAKDCFNYYRKHQNNKNLASGKSEQALASKFKSFLLKKQHLLAANNIELTRKALAYSAMNLVLEAYPIDKPMANNY